MNAIILKWTRAVSRERRCSSNGIRLVSCPFVEVDFEKEMLTVIYNDIVLLWSCSSRSFCLALTVVAKNRFMVNRKDIIPKQCISKKANCQRSSHQFEGQQYFHIATCQHTSKNRATCSFYSSCLSGIYCRYLLTLRLWFKTSISGFTTGKNETD